MFKRLKNNNKKGFTLVELIVVLVILAILAALLVPALTGYIDKAKRKQIVAETRQAVMAAQTLADEDYAKGDTAYASVNATNIQSLGEVSGTISITPATDISAGKIKKLVYVKDGITCTYDPDNNTGFTDGDYNVIS